MYLSGSSVVLSAVVVGGLDFFHRFSQACRQGLAYSQAISRGNALSFSKPSFPLMMLREKEKENREPAGAVPHVLDTTVHGT